MPRPSKADRWRKVHAEGLRCFNRIQAATWDDRQQSLEDRRFADIAGAQWDGLLYNDDDQRVRLEVNKVSGALTRIEGEHRNNQVTVDFLPKDGSPSDDLSDACNGLFRADEQDSIAVEAYNNAFSEGIRGGLGAWRLRACAEDEDNPRDGKQRVRIEPIVDADISTFWDLDSKRMDKLDAKHAFVVTSMSPEQYRDEFNDNPASWPKEIWVNGTGWDWYTPDVVNVAEFYVIRRESQEWVRFRALDDREFEHAADDFEDDEDDEKQPGAALLREILVTGNREIERFTKKVRYVVKYTMSAASVLREQRLPGRYIPIIPFYARRSFIQNKERWSGHVRTAKDAQRLTNMLVSYLAETAAHSPAEVPIFAPEQIDPFSVEWSEHPYKPKTYLRALPLTDADGNPTTQPGPMGYTKPPQIQPATAGLLQFIGADLKDLLGNAQAAEEVVSNISGKAVELFQQRQDALTLMYLDNFKVAMHTSGVVWDSIAKAIYVEQGRRMKTIGVDGSRSSVVLGESGVTDDGAVMLDGLVDLTRADLDVVVSVGPASATRKSKTVREIIGMVAVVPESDQQMRRVLTATALMNMDGEGLGPINEYARMLLVKEGVVKPTDEEARQLAEEAQAMAQRPPDPAAQANLAFAQKEANLAKKAVADTALALAKAQQTQAQTKKTEAETRQTTAETLAGVARLDIETRGPRP